ncbi:phospholipase D-like domain-containing protein [Actinomycetes bacterium NPDC127524]
MEPFILTGTILIGTSIAYALYIIPTKIKDAKVIPSSKVSAMKHEDEFSLHYIFSKSGQSIKKSIIQTIDQAKQAIDIASYSFTEKEIISRLCLATKRGVKVRVITDREQSNGKYQKEAINILLSKGIPVKMNTYHGSMHLKMLISDRKSVIAGSYNLSKKAETKNEEVMLFINNKQIGTEWSELFNDRWDDEKNFRPYYLEDIEKYA